MMSVFTDNGGYVVDGINYMECSSCGKEVKNVGHNAQGVICDRCLNARVYKLFPETFETTSKSNRVPTGRPAGWHFMAEFVDKDGNVFHKGVEQPELFGTLKPTKVKPKKKVKRKTKDEILVARHKAKLKAQKQLNKDLEKQKKFLMGEVDKWLM